MPDTNSLNNPDLQNKDNADYVSTKDCCDICDKPNVPGIGIFAFQESKGRYVCTMFICEECR